MPPVKWLMHWHPSPGATLNTQILADACGCAESLGGAKDGRWKTSIIFYRAMTRDGSIPGPVGQQGQQPGDLPRELLGVALHERPGLYFSIVRLAKLVLQADAAFPQVMEKLQSYKARVALNFEGFQYQLGDFCLRIGKCIPNTSEVLRGIMMELQQNGEYQLEEIIETSPFLERLILSEVFIGGDYFIEWEIRAPNLRHLTICSPYDCGSNLVDLPCLHSAVIELWEYVGDRDFAKFLSGLVHVRKLGLSTFFAPVNGVRILEILPCTFGNLKSLKLLMHFSELPPILFMFCLLRNTPNLEKLKILICWGEEQKIEANEEFLNAQWSDSMCAKLQVLKMTGINWLPNEMSFMKLILSKARLLHSLAVSHGDNCSVSHKDPLDKLLKCRRASAQAQVLFQGSAGDY